MSIQAFSKVNLRIPDEKLFLSDLQKEFPRAKVEWREETSPYGIYLDPLRAARENFLVSYIVSFPSMAQAKKAGLYFNPFNGNNRWSPTWRKYVDTFYDDETNEPVKLTNFFSVRKYEL